MNKERGTGTEFVRKSSKLQAASPELWSSKCNAWSLGAAEPQTAPTDVIF